LIAHTIPHGATLTVEVPSNHDNVSPLFLVLIPFNAHPPPHVVHRPINRLQEVETDSAVGDRFRLLALDFGESDRAAAGFAPSRILRLPADASERAVLGEHAARRAEFKLIYRPVFSLEREDGDMFRLQEFDIIGGVSLTRTPSTLWLG
jgi:hypothetical protein